jgi:hypothetical protein
MKIVDEGCRYFAKPLIASKSGAQRPTLRLVDKAKDITDSERSNELYKSEEFRRPALMQFKDMAKDQEALRSLLFFR